MDAKLVVVGGKASKGSISLKLPTVIGRSRDVTLTIAHPMISRRHCEIYEAGGLLMIRDLGSLNGTVIAGDRIKVAPLPPDGEFSIGPLTFRAAYEYDGDLSSLPAPVLAEKKGDVPAAASSDSPDFEAIDDAIPLESDAAAGPMAQISSKEDKEAAAKPKHGKASQGVAAKATSANEEASVKKDKKASVASTLAGTEKKPSSQSAAAKAKPAAARHTTDKAPTEQAPLAPTEKRKGSDEQPEDPFDAFLNELG